MSLEGLRAKITTLETELAQAIDDRSQALEEARIAKEERNRVERGFCKLALYLAEVLGSL